LGRAQRPDPGLLQPARPARGPLAFSRGSHGRRRRRLLGLLTPAPLYSVWARPRALARPALRHWNRKDRCCRPWSRAAGRCAADVDSSRSRPPSASQRHRRLRDVQTRLLSLFPRPGERRNTAAALNPSRPPGLRRRPRFRPPLHAPPPVSPPLRSPRAPLPFPPPSWGPRRPSRRCRRRLEPPAGIPLSSILNWRRKMKWQPCT
jgi:hypothetical protein